MDAPPPIDTTSKSNDEKNNSLSKYKHTHIHTNGEEKEEGIQKNERERKEEVIVCSIIRCGKRLRNTAANPRMNQKQTKEGIIKGTNDNASTDDKRKLNVLPPQCTLEADSLMLEC